jgi:arabinogalactan oligomer/maltooligosaccharide transport system permease protein
MADKKGMPTENQEAGKVTQEERADIRAVKAQQAKERAELLEEAGKPAQPRIVSKTYYNSVQKFKQKVYLTFVFVFLILVCLLVLYPLIYAVSAAFSPGKSISNIGIIPFNSGITTEHFVRLFKETNYIRWFRNTLIIATGTSVSTVFVCSLAAYVFSRFRFVFKKGMMLMLLVLQIFPSFIGMIAIYVILHRISGLDTLWGMVLIYLAGNIPYNTWLVKSYMDTIPRALDEAARIDGANSATIFLKVILPQATPIITFLSVASFTGPWMEFIFAKLILRSNENQTLALGLFSFVTDRKNEFTMFCAGALIVAIPFVIFFVITQKMLVTSLAGAGVKE